MADPTVTGYLVSVLSGVAGAGSAFAALRRPAAWLLAHRTQIAEVIEGVEEIAEAVSPHTGPTLAAVEARLAQLEQLTAPLAAQVRMAGSLPAAGPELNKAGA